MNASPPQEVDLFAVWKQQLGGWGIPDEILAAAPVGPWHFPTGMFAHRAREQAAAPVGPSYERASEALPSGGSVLDVGSGAGAASIPLARKAGRITAVDSDPAMLQALAELAAAPSGHPGYSAPTGHPEVDLVEGTWPAVAPMVGPADVVVCHHVLYNVQALRRFVEALTAHARRRVVVELTEHHPLEPMNPLWEQFWSLSRPAGPTAYDAATAITSLGLVVTTEQRAAAPLHAYDSFEEMVAYHRRRLCLPETADPEVGEALVALGVDPDHPVGLGAGRPLVTLWWDTQPVEPVYGPSRE